MTTKKKTEVTQAPQRRSMQTVYVYYLDGTEHVAQVGLRDYSDVCAEGHDVEAGLKDPGRLFETLARLAYRALSRRNLVQADFGSWYQSVDDLGVDDGNFQNR